MTDKNLYIALLVSTIIVFIIGVILITSYTQWNSIDMKNGQNFKVNTTPDKVGNIKFKNCIYTISLHNVTGYTGPTSYSRDITSQLNYMTAAYIGNTNPNYRFKLDGDGLSQYSFIIQGFSDYDTLNSQGLCGPTGNSSCVLPSPWSSTDPNVVKVSIKGYYK